MTCAICLHFKKTSEDGGHCKNTVGNKEVKLRFSCPFFANTSWPSVYRPSLEKQDTQKSAIEPMEMETETQSRNQFLYSDEEPKPRLSVVKPEPTGGLPSGNQM